MSSSKPKPKNWDSVSKAFFFSILICFLNSLLEGKDVLDNKRLSRRIWVWDFEGLGFEGEFFEEIQCQKWEICWLVKGEKFDRHLTLNSITKCSGKEGGTNYAWEKSQHKIHGIWNPKRKNKTWEQEIWTKLLPCSTKYSYPLRIWGQKMSLIAPKSSHHSWN